MKKGEWMNTFLLASLPLPVHRQIGEYMVSMPVSAEIMGIGLEDYWIVVISRSTVKLGRAGEIGPRKMLILGDGDGIEYKYTRYIGSVWVQLVESESSWRHVFEVTRPNDDGPPLKEDGKTLRATPGC